MGTWGTAIFSDDLAPKNLIHYLKNALHTTHPIFRLANTAIGVLFDDHEKQVIPKNICYPYHEKRSTHQPIPCFNGNNRKSERLYFGALLFG